LNHRLRVNLASFHYSWRSIQLQTNVNGLAFLTNAAAARTNGVDLDVEAQITHALRISAAGEWLDARFVDYSNAPGVVALPGGGNATTVINASGNRLPLAPKLAGSVSVVYVFPLPKGSLQASVTTRLVSRYYSEANNILVQRGFYLINTQLHWDSRSRNIGLTLWVNNITNTFYTLALTTQIASSLLSAAEPRTFGSRIEFHF
jgi:iron complex outermembrane receptor protein